MRDSGMILNYKMNRNATLKGSVITLRLAVARIIINLTESQFQVSFPFGSPFSG